MAWAERKKIIERIETARGSRVVCYVTSDRPNADAQINKDVIPILYDQLQAFGNTSKIDLFLFTNGGDTLAAFGIARLLREFSPKNIGVLIPLRCHSAGSLIALSANDIVMTKGATLSPIDPSILGALNPAVEVAPGQRQVVPLSVESVAGFKDLVTLDWTIKGEDALTAAFRVLAEKVHPLALGDVYRARQQIENLARTLLGTHRTDEENIAKIVQTLTRGLGSHDYPLSKTEARALFGAQIAADDRDLEKDVWDLYSDYQSEMEMRTPFDPPLLVRAARAKGQQGAVRVTQRLAVIETTASGDMAEREVELTELQLPGMPPGLPPGMMPGPFMPQGMPAKGIKHEVVAAGWRHYA